ncbi:MAG: hypothetical protein IIZ83_05125 [Oscillospiraceae bacterium]|nr:hypothetical protein [Oscillospiraceae bacterium]
MKEKIMAAQSVMLRLTDDLILLSAVRKENGTAIVRAQLEICKGRIFEALGALADLQHGVTAELDELRKEGDDGQA